MRKYWIWIVIMFLSLTGCTDQVSEADADAEKVLKPVTVMVLKKETRPVTLHYTGLIEHEEVKNYSFKTSGKINDIFVEDGQMVQKGDKLASLHQEEIKTQEYDLEKARANYDYVKDYYEKAQKLYQEGAISRQNFQEITLEMDQAKYTLEQTQKTLELNEKDTLITADSDGYVLSIVSRSNEVISAGNPVVIIGSKAFKGQIGLNQKDASQIKAGDEAEVLMDNTVIRGVVETVYKIPDEESRTYMADIAIKNNIDVNMGAVIQVSVKAGNQTGIWIPIQYLLNDGEDYVFVVENGKARRKNVQLRSLLEEKVCVDGLKEGEQLIMEGVKSVKDGTGIAVEKSETAGIEQSEGGE